MAKTLARVDEGSVRARPASSSMSGVVASLLDTFGRSLLAQIAGAQQAPAIDDWAKGRAEPSVNVASRLRAALDVVALLSDVETTPIIRAWFGGRNWLLGDRPPAVVIATDPDAVLRAARAFRAYG